MNRHIEELNYWRDSRNVDAARIPTVHNCTVGGLDCPCSGEGECGSVEVELPWVYVVCPVCDGRGTHVNPSIDASGLTAEDFDYDPEFREDYFSGRYDQVCNYCGGKRVIPDVDVERCDPELLNQYHKDLADEAYARREAAMERAMGA